MFFDVKFSVTAGRAVSCHSTAFHWAQQFGPCRVQLDPGNQLWAHIRHAQRHWPLVDVCSSWCACVCACLSAPSFFSRGYIELCLCQVPKPPIFPPLCSTSIFSIKFSSCWHFVHPPGPQIFIPAYHSRACGQCWIHASIRFLRLLPQEKKEGKKTCRHLHGPWTHNQSKNLKLLGSNAFSAPSQLKKVLCYAKATKKRKCIFFPMYCRLI